MKYETGSIELRAEGGGFSGWALAGAALAPDGALALDPATASRGSEPPGPLYAGGGYLAGEATSPELAAPFAFSDAIPSWSAATPPGSWIEVLLRARSAAGGALPGGSWTRWYSLGVWASGTETVTRHSVSGQDDGDAAVAVDTLSLARPADALQARFRIFAAEAAPEGTSPRIRAAALALSTPKPKEATALGEPEPGDPRLWGRGAKGVVRTSQMAYPDGGKVWCSPVSVSMVLGYWRGAGPEGRDERVRAAVASVYDAVFEGHGNWSFNAAYAASEGFEARVARFTSLARLEPLVAAGMPVVLSVSWDSEKGRPLSGAPVERSRGHLTLLVGFDDQGNPVMNEPAASPHDEAARTYDRREFEARWLEASGGAAYLIYPGEKAAALGLG